MVNGTNIFAHDGYIGYEERCRLLGQKGIVLWMTGLSGSGKSTIAVELEKKLYADGKLCYRLDGDNVRAGLNSDLSFTDSDRTENIRRITEVAKLFSDAGVITIVSFISPFKIMRESARKQIGTGRFTEIFVKASFNECFRRDPKGLYKKASTGEISNYTGIDSVYEEPDNPDLIIDTEIMSVEECTEQLMNHIISLI